MVTKLQARLTRLEQRADQVSRTIIVVGDDAELEALKRSGGIPANALVIITGAARGNKPWRRRLTKAGCYG